jgi:hypothetical protein
MIIDEDLKIACAQRAPVLFRWNVGVVLTVLTWCLRVVASDLLVATGALGFGETALEQLPGAGRALETARAGLGFSFRVRLGSIGGWFEICLGLIYW